MNLTDILLLVAVLILLVLFLLTPIWQRMRARKRDRIAPPTHHGPTSATPPGSPSYRDDHRRSQSGGARVNESDRGLKTGYRSVDPQQDLLVHETGAEKKNGHPHPPEE